MKKVIRFTASWCGPCKMMAKNLESINNDTPIEVVDIDENTDKAVEYNIRSVPTLVMLEDDKEVKRLVGMVALKKLEDWFND